MIKTKYGRFQPTWINTSLFIIAVGILFSTYLFQRFNFFSFFLGLFSSANAVPPYLPFVFNKTLRLIINDLACFILIYTLFKDKRYLKVAFWLFAFELLILLPFYFVLKLSLEGDSEISSPLLSQLHRLIINPMLMILLIIGFFYQRFSVNRPNE